jgi:ketosteroid isomerase-like protein
MDSKTEWTIEWECQKVLRRYNDHVAQREFEKAVALFAPDVEFDAMGITLKGRAALLEALRGALSEGTVRHVITNTVVNVIDENHATAHSYHTNYYSQDGKREEMDGPLEFEGPHRVEDDYVELVRTDAGWQIARRREKIIFRRQPKKKVGLEIWAEQEDKFAQGGM